MKKYFTTSAILCVVLILGVYYVAHPFIEKKNTEQVTPTPTVEKISMKLTSPAFDNDQKIPATYTCDGKKINPPLAIHDVPSDAKSLALIVDDPDAPNGTFTHWVIWNIHIDTTLIAEGTVPGQSQEGTNSAGQIGFAPLCPPSGQHRYFFTLYALDVKLGLDGKSKKTDVEAAMKGHIIAQSLLIGVYGR